MPSSVDQEVPPPQNNPEKLIPTTTSKLSIQEYFQLKMEEKKTRLSSSQALALDDRDQKEVAEKGGEQNASQKKVEAPERVNVKNKHLDDENSSTKKSKSRKEGKKNIKKVVA